jgi:hypothetical protein
MRYILLMNYEPGANYDQPMSEWPPADVTAHLEFQRQLGRDLTERGELVDVQALALPDSARFVTAAGGEPIITDGPFAEGKELLAGYWIVDVESVERALEIAAIASAAPGPGGVPIGQPIEVRQVMHAPAADG